MRNHHTVTFPQLASATRQVQNELQRAGLWNEGNRLLKVDVSLLPTLVSRIAGGKNVLGFVHMGDPGIFKLLGIQPGHIYIPAKVPGEGWSVLWGKDNPRGSLRDVLRHEYGHALAYQYPELVIDSPAFKTAFGGHHDDDTPVAGPDHHFVSVYAQKEPREDFAETFMFYLRHKQILPAKHANRVIAKKWRFIEKLCDRIAKS